ncbi:transcriptional regulator PpsR [Halovulum dunhuangense]|uniref:Transcriptional regulator PpsR n=1 Tax=Halovulum dunhuangense TaxID=1505036 RepID=A0A849KZ87_9RHOB|nr:transcriptional regulator PpsR [Halovulum dunhuangense]NNU79362.1 transcriptional regulator PpsR [Halovulum dunhuangense]
MLAVDAEAILAMVAASSDFVVVLSADLHITHVHLGAEAFAAGEMRDLRGTLFEASLTPESIPKFHALIDAATTDKPVRWRQVNHSFLADSNLAVSYAAQRANDGGYLLLGRDKRDLALLQQQLVQAQLTIEQDYERIRQVESRYRVLFETGTDALVILSADSGRIVDANSAAGRLLDREPPDLVNRSLSNKITAASQPALEQLLDAVRSKGGQKSTSVTLKADGRQIWLDGLLFRSVSDTLILCRLRASESASDTPQPFAGAMVDFYQRSGDAIVFTDKEGAILRSNAAFQSLANVAVPERLRGVSLGNFLGRPSVDLDVMTANAERTGRLSVYGTTIRTEFGAQVPVEISTTYLPDQQPPGFAFLIRDVTRLEASRHAGSAVSTEAVEHVIELVGSTPLKELVRSTTDVVEKLCIETAIRLTNNNRAAAAEMLGLSRQSLYVKLRRFGLIDQED